MAPEAADIPEEVEQLRRRFDEFRNAQPGRSRLPENLWAAAAELARRYGVNPTARALRLDYTGLRKRVKNQDRPKRKRVATPPSFLEFVAPGAKAVTNCTLEVESAQGGKLRLELKAMATTELANLIRAFVSQ
ncbi:MAG: hypothetical protein H0X25_13110 [Acidobacteriales bacterium]|nr:hypothetical protein [Terriglobales bacterium]